MEELLISLQRFADGGDGGAAGSVAGAEGTADNSGVATTNEPQTKGKKAKSNPLSNVQYGKTTTDEEVVETPAEAIEEETPKETETNESAVKQSFDELISGEFKEDFNAKINEIISNRFKNAKPAEETMQKLAPVLDILGKKYGVDATDPYSMDLDKFASAIENDDSLYEQEAIDKGLDVDTYKHLMQLERENALLKRTEAQKAEDAKKAAFFQQVNEQAEKVKAIYPTFDINTEMQNATFGRLVANGVPVQTAFEVVHRDEIQPQAMKIVAEKTAEQLSNKIKANGARPSENGLSSAAPSLSKSDPSTWSKSDMDEVRRRVANGEKIYL